jgi:hypothetical protein
VFGQVVGEQPAADAGADDDGVEIVAGPMYCRTSRVCASISSDTVLV